MPLTVRDVSFTEDGSEVFSVVIDNKDDNSIITLFIWSSDAEYEMHVGGMIL